MSRPCLLLDTSSLVYRAFFALPSSIHDPHGRPVNAVRGYLDMSSRLITDRKPVGMVHVLDADWRPAFRVAAYAGYKSQRREDPPELPRQFHVINAVLDAAGMRVASGPGYEADDVIGTLCASASAEQPVEVVTGDRDLLQLVRDPAVAVLFTLRGVSDLKRFDAAAVEARYGVPPGLYADLAILRGDPSDGLPGIKGVGEKTASQVIAASGGLDALLANPRMAPPRIAAALADPHNLEYIAAMRRVVPIPTDVTYTMTAQRAPVRSRLDELAREHGIEGPVTRLLAALEQMAAG